MFEESESFKNSEPLRKWTPVKERNTKKMNSRVSVLLSP